MLCPVFLFDYKVGSLDVTFAFSSFPCRSYHKDSYMANRRGDTLGQEGRYRRTASPQTAKKSAALLSQMAELSRQQVNLQQLAQPPPPQLQATQATATTTTAAEGDLVAEHNLSVGASGKSLCGVQSKYKLHCTKSFDGHNN